MRLQIRVSCKDDNGTKNFELLENDEIVFGRANPDLKTDDQRLSRRHFKVALRNSCIEITHLSKTNPTLMSTESEPGFERVTSKRSANRFCRVIAGSHKFLMELEGVETEVVPPVPTISSADPAENFSDDPVPIQVDSGPSHASRLNDEELDSWIIEPIIEFPEGSSLIEEASPDDVFRVPQLSHEIEDVEQPLQERATSQLNPKEIERIASGLDENPPIEKMDFDDDPEEPEKDSEPEISAEVDVEPPKRSARKPARKETPKKSTDPAGKMTFPIEEDFFD